MKIIDLTQGSVEWLDWRSNKRMASEASVVTGRNPWQKPLKLARVKKGLEKVWVNEAMQRGHRYEPEARSFLEAKLGLIGNPVVIQLEEYGASLDWLSMSDSDRVIGEIKIPSKEDSPLWRDGVVPDYYMDQVQQQLAVSGASVCYFLIYLPETQEGKMFEIYPDPKRWNEIREAWNSFWETYMVRDMPEDSERTDIDWSLTSEKYISVKKKIDLLTKEAEGYKKELIALSGEMSASGCGVHLIRSDREGSVSWAKVAKEAGVAPEIIEKYRGDGTVVFTLKID